MKLYSKQQVVRAAIVTAILTTVFIFAGNAGIDYLKNSFASSSKIAENGDASTAVVEPEQSTSTNTDNSGMQSTVPAEPSFAQDSRENYTQDELQNISVYEKNQEAVVNITTEVMAVNWFMEPFPQEGGSGSGSIIDERGYVVTNTHVIENAYKIYISLSDGTQYEGKVIGTDAASDIAVVKFDPPKNMTLKTISFGDSAKLKVGQKVIAIGNPFGFERTLTTGVISGLGRPIQTSSRTIIRDMIQTDTAINPGNSGGPLFDSQGRMIGINTMIYSTSGSSAGVGFAVPISTARRVVSELIQFGTVKRGTLDGTFVQLTSAIANYAKLPVSQGLLVSQLTKNGNAEKAGLRAGDEAVRYGSSRNSQIIYIGGDVITAINGIPVTSYADYYSALESKKPGDKVTVTVVRGKQQIDISIILSATTN